ncbi:copper resistance protein CopZ [Streptomyces agglomeratus]|uniref:copper chaperone PCu(A)C n=1 Tax=Streptomyces agglomeratus TaxID=285458 RepID=UPI0008545147|nr:copper chaperone PCu(A)C [Streptomyces agglomeratus]OEJ39848.1 copper resistance protein CopZ [Streptomyces agglomeratus]OEJ45773.1 copper resistance protein CopZ [Streptomyces agglomeratus]
MTRRRTALATAVAVAAGLALAGCSSSTGSTGSTVDGKPDLKVSGAFMPEPVMDDMAAGFLTITNDSDVADRLTSVTSDIAGEVQIHETKNQKMREVTSFDIPADGALDLERGGNHMMFLKLKKKPHRGENVSVELHFEKAGPIKAELPVKEPTHNPEKH